MTDPTVQAYEARAREAESSPIPTFLKIGRIIVWVIYALALINALLLTLAFFLRLAGANPDAGFVEWVYRSTDSAMRPFRGIFPARELGDASVLDFSLLFAAIVYFVVAILVDVGLRWLSQRLRQQERQTADLRWQADEMARRAAAEQQAAQRAAHEAAAREYAAQQAAANQYTIATTAAREVVAQQQAAENPPSRSQEPLPPPPR